MKKYELLKDDTVTLPSGKVLYRIRSLVELDPFLLPGDLGGYIESTKNLDQNGVAWVHDNARVYDNAIVSGKAHVFENAEVYGNAKVYGNALVRGNAKVYGNAWICGRANVFDNVRVYDRAEVYGDAFVRDDAQIYGRASVRGNAKVTGNADLYGNIIVDGNVCVGNDAMVKSRNDIQWFSNVGSECGTLTAYRTVKGVSVTRGCFSGTIDEFKTAVIEKHGTNIYGRHYQTLIDAIELWFFEEDCKWL